MTAYCFQNGLFFSLFEMKILVYRISSIGDIVLTTPVLRCLRKHFPDAEIHYITRIQYADVLKNNPYINKIHLVGKSPMEILPALKNEKFDYFVDLHKNIRSKRLRFALKAKYRSFPKLNFRKCLLTKFKIDTMPKVHIVDRYFEAVAALGVENDGLGLDYFLSENAQPNIASSLPEKYIVVAIGGTFATKRYPATLVARFASASPFPVVILGGNAEKTNAEKIQKSVSENVFNFCGLLTLSESAWLIQNAQVVVSNDTGMMHIAAAFKKPLVSLWGNTVPAFGMYPYFPLGMENRYAILENNNLKCRPCSKLGYDKCPKGHFDCMMKIAPQSVVSAMEKLLAD